MHDLGHGDMTGMIEDQSYFGPVDLIHDYHAGSNWALIGSGSSDLSWTEAPQLVLKSNGYSGPAVARQATQYDSVMPQQSIGGLGMPSGTVSFSLDCKPVHNHQQDVKAAPRRKKRVPKTCRATLSSGGKCDAAVEEKGRWTCHLTTNGVTCGQRFQRAEHRKRHWRGCKFANEHGPAPPCVLRLHCDGDSPCKELKGLRSDNMTQHISTHLRGGRNKCVDADFLFYCLQRHESEVGLTVSKAAANMHSALNILEKDTRSKPRRMDIALMERHEWYQDYLKSRASLPKEHRSHWSDKVEQVYLTKAYPNMAMGDAVLRIPRRKRTSRL